MLIKVSFTCRHLFAYYLPDNPSRRHRHDAGCWIACSELEHVDFVDILPINWNYHADPSQHSPVADITIGPILNSWPKVYFDCL